MYFPVCDVEVIKRYAICEWVKCESKGNVLMIGTVLVTEGIGFIASHVITVLLEDGYRVRATVTNSQEESQLRSLCPESHFNLETVEVGLFQDHGWESAVKGCRYVIHDATNVLGLHPSTMITPSNVQCTKRILKHADDGVKGSY
ncbi:uncharacterized protein LOC143243261 [Tachypleus tridentatus]|uniref:uncharacterized protein LOC143243261 n=1 Tax=Tachypleus tridentatus TaxID=6853 RepID=UPI003FD55F6F